MTYLEKLIREHATIATVTTISTATEKIAEEMAREILREPAFRGMVQALIRQAFGDTMRTLTNGHRRRGRTRRTRVRKKTRTT